MPDKPDLTAELDEAEAIVMGDVTTETEWGVRASLGHVTMLGTDDEAEKIARMLAADHARAGNPGALVRRTVTYGPWEEAPDA